MKKSTLKHLGHLLRQAMRVEDDNGSQLRKLVEQLERRERELDPQTHQAIKAQAEGKRLVPHYAG
jgi:hypothetical protein